MSYRHTVITEFVYKDKQDKWVVDVLDFLNSYGAFKFEKTSDWLAGYFHGIIRDLDGQEIKNREEEITKEIREKTGLKIKIVFE